MRTFPVVVIVGFMGFSVVEYGGNGTWSGADASRANVAQQADFEWDGSIAAGNAIEIKNVNGSVRAVAGSGNEVEVIATKHEGHKGDPDEVKVDPYGPKSPEYVAGDEFARMWCSALAFCQARFKGKYPLYKSDEASGGLGCFTPDSFPVFDVFRENCYIIADSNHGYKMLGVGKLVANELLGEKSRLLEPFRFSRYGEGRLHPVSPSPFPWS